MLVFIARNGEGKPGLVELIVIGSGTGIPSLRRGSPSLALLTPSARVWIDGGPGALRRLLESGTSYLDLDLVLYTHIHPDHISDLVPLLFACRYADQPRLKDLTCAGGPDFKHYFEQIEKLYGRWINPSSYRLTVKEVLDSPFAFKDFQVFSKPVAHTAESTAYRLEFRGGKSLVISGDTDYCQNIVDLARESDLLVLECSFPNGKKVEGHLTPALAGKIASESRCKRLLLTHFYPVCDQFDILAQCRETFTGEVTLAEDLMRTVV
jgi:ribonuclease BN (tRNA processing enzyme)